MQKKSLKLITLAAIIVTIAIALSSMRSANPKSNNKIQVAILLDVSGSMDGLIDQAKAQLWNMVSVLGKAKCGDNTSPSIEIALYEYGRQTNDENNGYVKQINSFINNLDSLSTNLFSLTTNGGDEYCGEVLYQAINQLPWASGNNYKVIFIAGNEDFLQGKRKFTDACKLAKEKGIIVNTIYCGDKQAGIREHWDLGSECGQGSFTNINQGKLFDIETPYDSLMYVYNTQLNGTYIGYNEIAINSMAIQRKNDMLNSNHNKNAGVKRVAAKAQANVYTNAEWDLVDKVRQDADGVLDKLDRKFLPDSLKTKSKAEIKQIVLNIENQRKEIQKQILDLNKKREEYIADYKRRNATGNGNDLETEIEKIILSQAKRFGLSIQ